MLYDPTRYHSEIIAAAHFVSDSGHLSSFLYRWQSLVGSLLGVFIPIVAAVGGYLLKEWSDRRKDWREALRRIEISTSRTLEDIFLLEQQFGIAIKLLRETIASVKSSPPNAFALDVTNFPVTTRPYTDDGLASVRTNSSYLHNNLIVTLKVLRSIDVSLEMIRNDYDKLIERNQFVVSMEIRKTVPNPSSQRASYAASLESFAKVIEEFKEKQLPGLITLFIRVRVYGRMLRKDYHGTVREYESKNDSSDPKTNDVLSGSDEIDAELLPKVAEELVRIRKRIKENGTAQAEAEEVMDTIK